MISAAYLKNTLEQLAIYFKKPQIPDLVFSAYVTQLSVISQEEFDKSIQILLFSAKNFPTPEEILAKAGKSPRQEAEIQWQLICTGKPRNILAHRISQEQNVLGELRTLEMLPPREYSYREGELKKSFVDRYCEDFIRFLISGKLEENLTEIDPNPVKSEEKLENPVSPEDWANFRAKIGKIGIKIDS